MTKKKSIPIRRITKGHEKSWSKNDLAIHLLSDLLKFGPINELAHKHDFYYMLIVESGDGRHTIDFNLYPVQDFSVFFIRPGQVHELSLETGSKGFILQFSREFIATNPNHSLFVLRQISHQDVFLFDCTSMQSILQGIRKISIEYQNDAPASMQVIQLNLQLILIELYRQTSGSKRSIEDHYTYRQEQLYRFLEFLQDHIHTKKQVNEYAELMNMTPYQLNRLTKQILSKTVSTLINEQLILEAKRLLMITTQQITQIAFELGYTDVSYFIRFFKKHTGTSPARFRQNLNKSYNTHRSS